MADRTCERCDRPSLGGGRWCYDHFAEQAEPRGRDGHGPRAENGSLGCGTEAGYRAHHRRGEKPCRRCLDAHAAYNLYHPNRHRWRDPDHVHDFRLDRETWRWVCVCGKRQLVAS